MNSLQKPKKIETFRRVGETRGTFSPLSTTFSAIWGEGDASMLSYLESRLVNLSFDTKFNYFITPMSWVMIILIRPT